MVQQRNLLWQYRKGQSSRMTDFGAFIELAPGGDALLHVSQISKGSC